MWVKPLQIQISGFWSTDRANPYFILQRRRGHDERRSGLATLLVATIDTVLDNKISRYRILYKRPDAEIYFLIAETDKKEDIEEHWKWIEVNMMPTLEGIDVADDISDFVQWKIKSLCTEAAYEDIGDIETEKFKNATKKFHKVFNMSMDEKLVIYYSCSFWRGRVPRQGYLYLSVNYLCFYSGLLGKEITIVIKFTDIISLERVHNIVSETIRICTRLHKYHFGMFRKLEETFQIMEQIANFAAKKSTDRANSYFILQRRRGPDERRRGLTTLLVATIDTVLDNKINRYRILYKRPDAEIYFLIAEADKKEDIEEHWKWIEVIMMPTLEGIDVADDINDFVQWKIKTLCTEVAYEDIADIETEEFKNAKKKFHKVFNMPIDEKLVIYYSCSFWRGRLPRQGYLYLSVNYLCFYSDLLGKEITIVIKFTDIISLERIHNIVSETIRICTRLHEYNFGMFRKLEETFQIMEQIANFAAKKLLSRKGAFREEDHFPAVT
ncbi:unnamed protein product, partial [Rotaria sordida]